MGWGYGELMAQPTWFVAELVEWFRDEQQRRRNKVKRHGKL